MGEMAKHIERDILRRWEEDEENLGSQWESFKEGRVSCVERAERSGEMMTGKYLLSLATQRLKMMVKKQIQCSGGGGSQTGVSGRKHWE